jgi:hypothetical protein
VDGDTEKGLVFGEQSNDSATCDGAELSGENSGN